jgi:uncharacterized membrane protein YvbJ
MALIKCPKCGEEISDRGIICPHCHTMLNNTNTVVQSPFKNNMMKCPDCGKEISETADFCPNCGCTGKKLKEQKQLFKHQKTMEEWNNMTPSQKKGGIIAFIVIAIIIILIIVAVYPKEADHKDGKCDICGKAEYSTINGEEFCYDHYKSAIDYYIDD